MIPLLIVFLVSHFCAVQGGSSCKTPANTEGQCININKCPELLSVELKKEKTSEELTLLRESKCGIDATNMTKVCCPQNSCFTLEGRKGNCVDIHSCPPLESMLQDFVTKQKRNYVRNNRCDDLDENRVCCMSCEGILGPPLAGTGCCGVSRTNERPDTDNANTMIDQYPWMAIIEKHFLENQNRMTLCLGSLISSKYVLTIASCVASSRRIPNRVILGEYNYFTTGPDCVEKEGVKECTDGAIVVAIEKIIVHQNYQLFINRHNIALLRLQNTIQYTDFIRPICLPTTDIDPDEPQTFYIAGWGKTEDFSVFNIKLHVDLPSRTMDECKNAFPYISIWKGLTCSGGVEGRGACDGDKGGPLMLYNGKFFEATGIVSYFLPDGCGVENVYNLNINVYEYLPWIRKNIKP